MGEPLSLEDWSLVQSLALKAGVRVTRTKDGFRCRRADIVKPFSYWRKNITVTAQVRPDVVEELKGWMTCHPQFDRLLINEILWRTRDLAGTVPLYWEYKCELYQYIVAFGFDDRELALAAQQRLHGSGFHSNLTDEAAPNEVVANIRR